MNGVIDDTYAGDFAMDRPLRVVHYLNQFFGQIGGEDKADTPLSVKEGPVGPGLAVQAALGQSGSVVGTVICGDNSMGEALEERAAIAAEAVAALNPDLLFAGPAFGAGRYGMACGAVSKAVGERLSIPVVAGMHESNPAVSLYKQSVCIIPSGPTSASMRQTVASMVSVGLQLCRGEKPESGSYFSQGIRVLVERDKSGACRAADMLLARLQGLMPPSEIPLLEFDRVPPAPALHNLASALIVPVTEGGLAPRGNPDRIEASMATKYGTYSIEGLSALSAEAFEAAHGGYDNSQVNADPNRLLPLDALRHLERNGEIGGVAPVFYSTAGNATSVDNATRFGREIAEDIRKRFQQDVGVFLTAT